MSDTNNAALRYVAETTPGTTPNTPAFQDLVYRSSSLRYNPETTVDDSIVTDRQVLDLSLVGYDVSGENAHRLRYGALDDHYESALMSSWAKLPNLASSAYASATGTYTVASGGAAFLAGHLIIGTGYAIAGNNMVAKKVASSTATTVVTSAGGTNDTAGTIRVVGFEGASADIAATASGLSTTALNFINLGVVVGMWLKIGGSATGTKFNTSANNGWARVSAVTATTITFDSMPTGWAVDAGAGKTIRVFMGDYVRNGSTRKSFTYERAYLADDGASTRYRYFRGCFPNVSFNISAKEMIEVGISVMGMSASTIETTRATGATTVAPVLGDVFNASSNIGSIRHNNVDLATPNFVLGATVNIENNFRGRAAVGQAGFADIRAGTCDVTGTIETYLGDASMLNMLQNNTATSLALPMMIPYSTGGYQGYHIDMPRCKFSGGGEEVDGQNSDIAPELEYRAMKHPTLGYSIQLQRYAYLEF